MKILLLMTSFLITFNIYAQEIQILQHDCHLEKKSIELIRNSLNFQVSFYNNIFQDSSKVQFKARIFGSYSEFIEYSKQYADFNPVKEHAIAFYSSKLKEMIIPYSVDNFERIFAHELNHALLDFYCRSFPTWLEEGLSEFQELIELHDDKYVYSLQYIDEFIYIKDIFAKKSGKIIDKTIRVSDRGKEFKYIHYKTSLAIAYYLYQTNPTLFSEIIRQACNYEQSYVLMEMYYPGGLHSLKSDVLAFYFNAGLR